ncbi:MAG: hypothetical protein IKK39_10375 [Thermoguttaceae bacterium]|nr:hypothetical protein [Thermoguttaceae bacterium]MBR4104450.1 hypothetical protein [Thermoguttaceae bacterium]
MSHWKKIVLSPYFAATTGATALALTLGAANAQNAPTPSVPAPTDAPASPAPSPTPTPANPNPLGIGAPSVPASPVPTTLQLGGAPYVVPAPSAAASNDVEALRAQVRTLEGRLRQAPTTAAEQDEQMKIVAELAALQRQIQQAEAAAGDFATYRRNRAAQEGVDLDAALDANLNANSNAAPNFNSLGSIGATPPNAAIPLAPGEAELLRAQKEELTRQYRQLQQTLRALSPSDEALAESLRAEQTTLLNQLKEIDERLANAPQTPATSAIPNAFPNLGGDFANAIPPENRLPAFAGASELTGGNDVAAKMQKAQEAAEILRSVGLVNLAGLATAEIPRLADPNFAETRYVPGTWTEGAGLAEERYNPFQQISKDEIDAIKTSIDDLKARVDSLTEIMSNVETQLKLLTRQTVDAASPVAPVVPTPETPAPATDAPETPAE